MRSFLFVPGDRDDMLTKAPGRGADALILDLEDAVAPSRKMDARAIVTAWLDTAPEGEPEIWVRVNGDEPLQSADLAVLDHPRLTGVMVPKVRSVAEIEAVATVLDGWSRNPGAGILPIVETAAAIEAASPIAASPRVRRLMIGEFDLAADLGVDSGYEPAFVPLRMAVVVASAAAGIKPPLGPVTADYRDLDALRAQSRSLKSLGFGCRPAIHPAQVPVYNDVFSPDPAEIDKAKRVIDLYDRALAEGRGAVTDEDGAMVDEAVVKMARRVLDNARKAGLA